jgi:hypothetical protein
MRVFSIEGKFQQNGRYSELPADFNGYFVLEESGQIKGYMEEQYSSPYNTERYIYGKYDETNNNLVYLKLSTERKLSPLIYCFPNLEKEGYWTPFYHIFGDFFEDGNFLGHSKATIKEDTQMSPDEILARYSKVVRDGWNVNMTLIENGVDKYMGNIFREELQD